MRRRTVPALTQYATPRLVASIVYDGHPAEDDPEWRTSGAPSAADYGVWAGRWCGLTCLRMALLARDGAAPSLWELLTEALPYGVYQERDDGTVGPGLIYRPFADFVGERHGLRAEVITELTADRLRAELDAGRLVLASVHREIRRPDRPAPGRGGHLVLATRHPGDTVAFHNPSGHTPETVAAALPADVFDAFAAHRGVALHL
ncbi:peptidase C39-like protein [Actinocorallia herbida]|uniref:Peptidase C39-like protein n=1 Tax=Actinocorallia herbida TaxID=58109 RepID=A0A3N1D105_9ACTN|nr:C39 family peptidase [Actinocorallia herbida]ROO86748.1 peptidase C39-like protein [Actinocorallia herbida]